MKFVVGDKKLENAKTIATIMNEAGFDVVPMETDIFSEGLLMCFLRSSLVDKSMIVLPLFLFYSIAQARENCAKNLCRGTFSMGFGHSLFI